MTSSLTADEMLCEIRLRPWPAGHGYAFLEFSRRKGDFAIVSVAALIVLDCAGRIARASLTLGGVGPTPLRMPGVEASLAGACADAACIERAAAQCARIDALSDPAVPAWYRQHLAAVLAQRALTKAVERAHAPGAGKDV
jgi:carbon-monoxide dehydrogenase medium subunit